MTGRPLAPAERLLPGASVRLTRKEPPVVTAAELAVETEEEAKWEATLEERAQQRRYRDTSDDY